jgi:hypothetical protein
MRYCSLIALSALALSTIAACGNELPDPPAGNRIRGSVALGPFVQVPELEQPAIRVFAFFNFPPGSAFAYNTLIAPDFSSGPVPFEIDRIVATPGYTIAAVFVDLATTAFFPTAEEALGNPVGAYPDVCKAATRAPDSLVEVTEEAPTDGIDFRLYPAIAVQDGIPIPADPCIAQGGLDEFLSAR